MSTTEELQMDIDPKTTTPPGSPAPSVPSPNKDHLRYSPDPATGPGGYPEFCDGDVLIKSGTGKIWKLHSEVLRNASKKFRTMLDTNEPLHITKKAKEDGNLIKWKLEMIAWEDKPADTRFRSFRVSDKSNRSLQSSIWVTNVNGVGDVHDSKQYLKIYDNFFRCLYDLPIDMTNDTTDDGAFFILDAVSLLQAAESLEAAKVVRLIIEAKLLRLTQVLWRHIERNPEAWADIAIRLESPIIFREAMIHIVGRFDLKDGTEKLYLMEQEDGKFIIKIATEKARELKEKKLAVERRLTDFYPKKMVHFEGSSDVPGRAIYATDIYLWQALTIVRQYLASSYMSNHHHRAADGGVHFFRCIGEGDSAYLRKDTLDRFHDSFAMSTKGKQCLAVAVEYIKDQLRPIVEELLMDRTQLNRTPNQPMPKHLTCTEILDEELPWVVKANAEAARITREATAAPAEGVEE